MISRYVVTRPYRAPEIILTDVYGRPVDLWSIGCVLAELIINRILFDERDSLMLVYCIMQYIGVSETDIQALPEYVRQNVLQDKQRFTTSHLEALLRRNAPDWNSSEFGINELIDFTKRLLTFNPAQRITAEQALNLPMWEPMGNSFYSNGDENQNGIYVEDNQRRTEQQWKRKYHSSGLFRSDVGGTIMGWSRKS
uniref:Protein kinase domain-containing protein n=1 Tax=Panagrolaimus superbus TaxID=310955 RepID=A0A914XWX8_9BILA